jgi:hypothetical protein
MESSCALYNILLVQSFFSKQRGHLWGLNSFITTRYFNTLAQMKESRFLEIRCPPEAEV